jgi:SprT protein
MTDILAWKTQQEKIREETLRWYSLGIQLFPQQEKPVEITFNVGGSDGGHAFWGKNSSYFRIDYNWGLAQENFEHFVSQTVPHEVAHLIANEFFKEFWPDGVSHSDLWKFVMMKFGKSPDRCHSYNVENVKGKKSVGQIVDVE